ncbi:hypothetical protein MNBD_ALPHA01-962 [hydrothermal vent metagenome]|uniref:Uncharacterized protein n=1 Tax=hydrothermal vent metagenome TaxID=652676 RepID=A0A3B0SH31_9ZZZZ
MYNLLINNTDPYSFMGLIRATPVTGSKRRPSHGLINAGIISMFMIAAIAHTALDTARAKQVPPNDNALLRLASGATGCSFEACNMV